MNKALPRPSTTDQKGDQWKTPYSWAGDEHGRLDLAKATLSIELGDRLEFFVPHCDPTVNLYNEIYATRGEMVEAVWKIAARGLSQ